jgi:hypothetical protein
VRINGKLHDVRILQPEAMPIPANVVRMRLVCRNLQAVGFAVGDRFFVVPGADYSYECKSGLSKDNRRRREAIEKMDILQPLPDVTDHARLRVGLDCKSPAIAAKVLSGEHIGTAAWQAYDNGPDGDYQHHHGQQQVDVAAQSAAIHHRHQGSPS